MSNEYLDRDEQPGPESKNINYEPLHCSITDVVASVYCEQKAVYDKTIGDRSSAEQRALKKQGVLEHLNFETEGKNSSYSRPQDQRCFIASQIYGPNAAETNLLRSWRDTVLRRTLTGRIAIRLYYAVSPRILPVLGSSRWMTFSVRRALDQFIRLLK